MAVRTSSSFKCSKSKSTGLTFSTLLFSIIFLVIKGGRIFCSIVSAASALSQSLVIIFYLSYCFVYIVITVKELASCYVCIFHKFQPPCTVLVSALAER